MLSETDKKSIDSTELFVEGKNSSVKFISLLELFKSWRYRHLHGKKYFSKITKLFGNVY